MKVSARVQQPKTAPYLTFVSIKVYYIVKFYITKICLIVHQNLKMHTFFVTNYSQITMNLPFISFCFSKKRIKKIHASYTLEGTDLENVESIKYLGVTITSDLRWNTHVSNVCTKANRTLGFLRRNLYSCPQEVKEAAYKGLVCPVLDYGSSVWDPPGVVLQEELESVQKRAARFVTGNYNYETGSMTGILEQLKWESLKKRRKDNRLILLYKGLKGKASVPTDDLIPKTRRCRNQHSMAFQTPIANTDVYKGSFFPQTIRDWNALPDSLISSAEDAEDCVAKFTSLVRARD